MNGIINLIFSMSLLVLISCVSQTQKKSPAPASSKVEEPEEIQFATDAGKELIVEMKAENVRKVPNGKILGRLYEEEKLTVIKRVGNWINFTNSVYEEGYIWAPSVGYSYVNLYNPYFFYDTTRHKFKEIEYFQKFFSKSGQRRQETDDAYELFFKNIGLGSHEATVLDVVTETQQIVEHGITLFINKNNNQIEEVRVDYLKPVKGYKRALRKSELPVKSPSGENTGHLIWAVGELLPDLVVDLERKAWKSQWFRSIWYKLPDAD